ncbi:MAG: GNAT family N-acetyltransferase, partial [Actinomycetota bacterium]|nr:GNAT family N-acetyltransferase [Actinomycetota bacterium]
MVPAAELRRLGLAGLTGDAVRALVTRGTAPAPGREGVMELRRVKPEAFEAWVRAVTYGFGGRFHPEVMPDERALLDLDRTLGWRDGDGWVAGASALPFTLSVPGGALPATGVTAVAVLPTHRRQGLMTGLMERLLADARERGDVVAALWAAESPIYGRFGFGMATPHRALRSPVPTPPSAPTWPCPRAPRRPPRRCELGPRLAPLAERERARRPGLPARDERYWRHAQFGWEPDEIGERRVVVFEGPGSDEGYALHRVVEGHDDLTDLADGRLQVEELVALTPEAAIAL